MCSSAWESVSAIWIKISLPWGERVCMMTLKSHQASLLVVLWSHQDFIKIYAHCLRHLIVCCGCLEPYLLFCMWKTTVWKNIFHYVDFWRKRATKNQTSNLYRKQWKRYRWAKKDLILRLISIGKRRMEIHALPVNICKQECAPFLQLNKFNGPGERFDALS